MTDLSEFAEPCPDCRQPIMWPWTAGSDYGKRMPVDAEPVPSGNVRVYAYGPRLCCDVIGNRDTRRKLTTGGHLLYQHHRISCTRAEKWARPQRKVPAVPTAGTPGEGLF